MQLLVLVLMDLLLDLLAVVAAALVKAALSSAPPAPPAHAHALLESWPGPCAFQLSWTRRTLNLLLLLHRDRYYSHRPEASTVCLRPRWLAARFAATAGW